MDDSSSPAADPTQRTDETHPLSVPEAQEATGKAAQEEASVKRRGASAEQMRAITARRMEMAKTDPSKKGGRPRTRYSKAEVEERALQRMMPKALKVLEAQLESRDQRVQQSAAVKVLEYVKGKPVQQIDQRVLAVQEIRYEAAAWSPSGDFTDFPLVEIAEADLPALPPADAES